MSYPDPLPDIETIMGGLKQIQELSSDSREKLRVKLVIVNEIIAAPRGTKIAMVNTKAKALGVSASSLNRWICQYKAAGWIGLLDGREFNGKPRTA